MMYHTTGHALVHIPHTFIVGECSIFEFDAESAGDVTTSTLLCSGLTAGDEILVMNGRVVAALDMVYVENLLHDEQRLTMTVRSCKLDRPSATNQLQEHADAYIDNMVCPPPPSQSRISEKVLEELVVPAPSWGQYSYLT